VDELNAAVKVEEISPVKKKVFIDVPWVDVKKERDAVYRDYSKKAKIKGFRQGKIPRKILEIHYKEIAEEETISNLVNKFYGDVLKDHNLKAVSQPEIEQKGIDDEKGFSFSATFEVEPEIEPQGYLNMALEKDEFTVTEEEVNGRLEEIRKMFGTLEVVTEEREIKKDGKGRPMKVYRLTISLGDIIKHFEDEKRKESVKTLESIEKLKELSRSLSVTP